jgi:hypothetical protein
MANLIAELILLILGGFMIVCTHATVRLQIWSQRAIMGAQYVPSKRTYTMIRIIGAILVILSLMIVIGILR